VTEYLGATLLVSGYNFLSNFFFIEILLSALQTAGNLLGRPDLVFDAGNSRGPTARISLG